MTENITTTCITCKNKVKPIGGKLEILSTGALFLRGGKCPTSGCGASINRIVSSAFTPNNLKAEQEKNKANFLKNRKSGKKSKKSGGAERKSGKRSAKKSSKKSSRKK